MSNANIKVGDIFRCTFGYSMTLNSFYQVVGKKGASSVQLRRINGQRVDGDGWSGKEAPVKDSFATGYQNEDQVVTKRVTNGAVKVFEGRGYLHEEGKAYYYNRLD
jgi:hypothetical protein